MSRSNATSSKNMNQLMNKDSSSYLPAEAARDLDQYRNSFKEVIKLREKNSIPFLHTSPQISYRPGIINYLRRICIDKKFSHCCLHLAVYLLDIFMDCHNIVPDKILLLANVCLLLAAKFEENIRHIPKISELNAIVHYRYTIKEYKAWEVTVLDYFSWYIRFPTVAYYAYYYMQSVITYEELKELNSNITVRTIMYEIQEHVLEYLDQVIENIHYMQDFKPSQLAAAILAASRLECGLQLWTDNLEDLTDYTTLDIQGLIYTLHINKYSQKIEPMLPYSHLVCTFRENYCRSCSIKSCPKCFFLKKV